MRPRLQGPFEGTGVDTRWHGHEVVVHVDVDDGHTGEQ